MSCECAALYTYPERSNNIETLHMSKTSGASFTSREHCSGGSKEFATPGCCLLPSQPSGSWGLIGPYNIHLGSKALRKAWLEECVRHSRISHGSSVIAASSSELGSCLDSHSNVRPGVQCMCGHRSPDFIWRGGSVRKESP